jgi:hypothetical protein
MFGRENSLTNATVKAIATLAIVGFCMAIAQVANAQEAAPAAPVYKISPESASAARRAVTANGKRSGAENSRVHIQPTLTAKSTLSQSVRNRTNFYGFKPSAVPLSPILNAPVPGIQIQPNDVRGSLQKSKSPFPLAPPGEFNPATLAVTGGDPAGNLTGVVSAQQANIYLNCPAHNDSCWGDGVGSITAFQTNLANSRFITIADQYVGSRTRGRYPLGIQHAIDETIPNLAPWNNTTPVLLDSDAQALAFAAASNDNNFGFGFVYHVFVPQGTDVCFDNSFSVCYSPDNNSTFFFCGYHGSFDQNGHHILYSVQPYGPVDGCFVPPMSNTDAQVNILGHETFEAITDPDPNFEWNSIGGFGEIGDICEAGIFAVPLGKTTYNIQLMYSNKGKQCRAVP